MTPLPPWPAWESFAAAPLFGVELAPGVDRAAPGLVFGGPDFRMWSLMEKTGPTRDSRLASAYWDNPPAWAVVRIEEDAGEEVGVEIATRELEDLVLALRLADGGPLADPSHTGFYIRQGAWNRRQVGYYRMHFWGRRFDPPYRLDHAARAALEQRVLRLRSLRATAHDARIRYLGRAVRQALESPIAFGEPRFHDPRFRVAGAFALLESLFGRAHETRAGRSFARRVGAAAGTFLGDADTLSDSMESDLLPLRNRLVHGAGAEEKEASAAIPRLVLICRSCLTAFLDHLAAQPAATPAEAEEDFNARCAAAT